MNDDERKKLRKAVVSWWRRLHPDDEGGQGDRATLARLRRASSLFEVMVEAEAIRLYRHVCDALGRESLSDREAEGVAILAGVLAAVKPEKTDGKHDLATFATMLGRTAEDQPPREGERARYSPLRFNALVRADDPEERLRHLRRTIALSRGRTFNVGRFAEDMLWWGDRVRRRWVFEYYQQGRAAPDSSDTEKTEENVR